MTQSYATDTQHFTTVLDFLRFGLSKASEASLHYGHGTDNAYDDIFALVLGSLSLPLDIDVRFLQARITDAEAKHLCRQLERRICERVPVPYLTHEAYFCDLPFYVDERVLIPRSPIAELIKAQFTPWVDPENVGRVLDMCTGSGCIAIACSVMFPQALVDAVDISKEALAVAAINREKYAEEGSVNLIESDCFASVPKASYDIIVSNPPYVSRSEMGTLPTEYAHEPKRALEAAHEGLDIIEKILRSAHAYLSKQGVLIVEVGNSEQALIDAYPQVPFTWLDFEHGGQGVFLLTAEQVKDYF